MVYLNAVVPAKRWPWLRGHTQIEHRPFYSDGTVACTPDSTTITFSVAPSTSKTGYLFAIDSFSEVYQISAHTAGATTATLVTPFTGTLQTAADFKVWTDTLVLPTDCRETIEVYHSFFRQPLEPVGLQELRRRVSEGPYTQGRPEIYSTYDYVGTTESSRYRVMKIHPSIYPNSTTLSVDYVAEVTALDLTTDEPAMPIEDRVVLVYGALERAWKRFRNPEASEQSRRDFQEKIAQMAGRVEDSQDNAQLTPSSQYLARKRGRQATKAINSTGSGSGSYTVPSYLANTTINGATITGNVTVNSGITIDGVDISVLSSDFSAHLADTTDAHDASAISFSPTGTIAATDVQSAIAEVSSDVTSLGTLTSAHIYVGNASNVATDVAVTGDIAITNAGVTSISSGVIVNADVNASAAIDKTKLAAGTASRVEVTDGSGNLTESAITSTELTYLDDVEPLTSFSMADNQASAADVATWTAASFDSIWLEYSLKRGASNKATGQLMIATDGTDAAIAQSEAAIGTLGVTFSVDVSAGSLRLRYVTTSTGTAPTMKYRVRKNLA